MKTRRALSECARYKSHRAPNSTTTHHARLDCSTPAYVSCIERRHPPPPSWSAGVFSSHELGHLGGIQLAYAARLATVSTDTPLVGGKL